MEGTPPPNHDHLASARNAMAHAEDLTERGQEGEERYVARAAALAQIDQAESLRRLCALFDGTTDAPGLIGVTGHVTTGMP